MPIPVALIGCGYWGSTIVRELMSMPTYFRVVSFTDISSANRRSIRNVYQHIPVFPTSCEMYDSVPCDAIIIATPTATHTALATEALKRQKHVWIEKPVAQHTHEIDEIIRLQRSTGTTVFADHTYRYDEGIQCLSRLVYKQHVHPIYEIRSVRTSDGIFRKDESVAWDLLVHDITIGSVLFGGFPVQVAATGSAFRRSSPLDTVAVHLLYPHNRHMYVTISWQAAYKTRHIDVIGPKTIMSYDERQAQRHVTVFRKTGSIWNNVLTKDISLTHQSLYNALAHFADCIWDNAQPMTGLPEGKQVIKILEAVDESLTDRGLLKVV